MLKIILISVGILIVIKILWNYFNSHPSDKYHNDTWKDDKKKNKKTRQN